tara:strand:- start:87 stop:1997 length:1911 start_codon:yes stop_codon:yes gene_type:complete
MALIIKDRVKQTTTSHSGANDFVMNAIPDGFQSFTSVLADGDTTYYCAVFETHYEVGLGTWAESTSTLARTTILESSNSGNAVTAWGTGVKTVFITNPAEKNVLLDSSDNLIVSGLTLDTSQNATFSGDVNIESATPLIWFKDSDSTANNMGATYFDADTMYLYTRNGSSHGKIILTSYNGTDQADRLTIDTSGNSTFSGTVTASGFSGKIHPVNGVTTNYLSLKDSNELNFFNSSGVSQTININYDGGNVDLGASAVVVTHGGSVTLSNDLNLNTSGGSINWGTSEGEINYSSGYGYLKSKNIGTSGGQNQDTVFKWYRPEGYEYVAEIDSTGSSWSGARAMFRARAKDTNFAGLSLVTDNTDGIGSLSGRKTVNGETIAMYVSSNDLGNLSGTKVFEAENPSSGTTNFSVKIETDFEQNVGIGGVPVPTDAGYNNASLHMRGTTTGSQVHFTTPTSGHTASDGGHISYWNDNHFYHANIENGQFRFYSGGIECLNVSPDSASNADAMVGIGIQGADPNGWRNSLTIGGYDNGVDSTYHTRGSAVYLNYNNAGSIQRSILGSWLDYVYIANLASGGKIKFATGTNQDIRVEIEETKLSLKSGVSLEFPDGTTQSTASSGGGASAGTVIALGLAFG